MDWSQYLARVHRSFSFSSIWGKYDPKPCRLETKKIQAKPAHPRVCRSFSFLFGTGNMCAKTVSLRTIGPCYKLPPTYLKHASKTHIEIGLQGVFMVTAVGALDFPQYTLYLAQWFDPRTIAEFALTVRAAKSHKIEHVQHSYFTILLIRPESLPPPPPHFRTFSSRNSQGITSVQPPSIVKVLLFDPFFKGTVLWDGFLTSPCSLGSTRILILVFLYSIFTLALIQQTVFYIVFLFGSCHWVVFYIVYNIFFICLFQ